MRWMVLVVAVLTLALALIMLTGCAGCAKPPVLPIIPDEIRASTNVIRAQKPNDVILRETDRLDKIAAVVDVEFKNLTAQIEKLKSKDNIWLQWGLAAVTVAGIVGIPVSGVLIYRGSSFGLPGLLASIVTVAAAKFMPVIAYVGAGILLLLIIAAVWLLVRKLRKAVREIVPTAEAAKNALPPEVREAIFGEGGIADEQQSKSTKEIVKRARLDAGLTKKGDSDAATPGAG